MLKYRLAFRIVAVAPLLLQSVAAGQEPRTASDFGAQAMAKIMCSAVFVSGRDLDEAVRNSTDESMVPDDQAKVLLSRPRSGTNSIDLDRAQKIVRVTLNGFTGRARYFGDQGCVILPSGQERVFFSPTSVTTRLPDAMSQPWPMGDSRMGEDQPWPSGLDKARVQEAVTAAFAGESLTAAFLVLYRGQIVAEQYGQGATKDTQLESWSMGKSLTATLLGLLVKQGQFAIDDPAPVPVWHADSRDPRARIRIADLMRMSSGLRFTHQSLPRWEWGREIGDHLYVYAGGIDAFHFSITRPAEHPPNTIGRYRNCDPLTLGYIIRQTVERMGENYHQWPQKALFDRIGIRRQVMETDPYGNFLLTGYDYGTARNWARLGLLYLQDGVWNGERLLPEGWVKFVSTPAPAWTRGEYGGLFWVNTDRRWQHIPPDAFYMSGAGGQHVIIIPQHDLVVVRMGHRRGQRDGTAALNDALGKLMEAVRLSGSR